MRPEKKYLVNEAKDYLSRSDYFFLTDYKGINSEETSNLRKSLAEKGAEFHVVKNSSLSLVAKEGAQEDQRHRDAEPEYHESKKGAKGHRT